MMKSQVSAAILAMLMTPMAGMMPTGSSKPTHVPRPDLLEQVLAEAKVKRDRKRKKRKA